CEEIVRTRPGQGIVDAQREYRITRRIGFDIVRDEGDGAAAVCIDPVLPHREHRRPDKTGGRRDSQSGWIAGLDSPGAVGESGPAIQPPTLGYSGDRDR